MASHGALLSLLPLTAAVFLPLHFSFATAEASAPTAPRCRLYLAPSSPSGVGVFTAVPLSKGDLLSLPDVIVNVPDLDRNRHLRGVLRASLWSGRFPDDEDDIAEGFGTALDDYSVDLPSSGLFHARFDAEAVTSVVPGVATLLRKPRMSSVDAPNVRGTRPAVDGAGLSRTKNDPGVGAFTHYHGYDHEAIRDVPAGAELFVEDWNGDGGNKQGGEFSSMGQTESPQLLLKTSEWLEEHGLCLDNLRPGNATVDDQAGRGAFASRRLFEGEVIVPVPVVPVRRSSLGRYDRDQDDVPVMEMGDNLLRNYCYGHPDSSVLLFPRGPAMNLVNHASKRTGGKKGPNAELRWSSSSSCTASGLGDGGPSELLGRPAKEVLRWRDDSARDGLLAMTMELVALRDIEKDEEVLIDYGSDWELAWGEHVRALADRGPILNADKHIPAHELNADPHSKLETEDEEAEESLINSVVTMCRVIPDIGKRDRYEGESGTYIVWVDGSKRDPNFLRTDVVLKSCDILRRWEDDEDGKWKYTVRVDFSTLDEEGPEYVLTNVPRWAIEFVNTPYANDQYLRAAFRHEIGLPEGVFPEAWMDQKAKGEGSDGGDDDTCGLYMAPSSIPNSGLGMYTAREISLDRTIFYPDVIVHQYEHDTNNDLRRKLHGIDGKKEPEWLLHSYYWESRCTRGFHETKDGTDTITMVPGLGMLANSHTGLVNALMRHPEIDPAGLHRARDPGVGAYSEFHEYRYEAVSLHPDKTKHRPIPAGMELFVEYGDSWFEDREWLFGPIPLSTDFAGADRLLDRFLGFVEAINRTGAAEDLWDITSNFVKWSARMDIAMPHRLEDIRRYQDVGSAMMTVPDAVRSPEWLEENGLCLDNIKAGRSTVRQAGRGAFTTRSLAKGAVIAPAPMAHIHRKHLGIYEQSGDGEIYLDAQQLLLNYCYGHPKSSLLLFPYSPVVNLINHAPEGTEPNAYVRWSSLPSHRSDWYDSTVDELMKEKHAGLILEFVALRDIEKGEEIFIDYGNYWSSAWHEHIEDWLPVEDAEDYIPASKLNALGGPIRTDKEQNDDPYPDNVKTVCYVPKDIQKSYEPGPHDWYSENRLVDYSDFGSDCIITEREDYDNLSSDSVRPFFGVYTARVAHWTTQNKYVLVSDMPRSAIEFVDKPYTRDQFLHNAFRHEINVPNGMFPKKWMDLLENGDDEDQNIEK